MLKAHKIRLNPTPEQEHYFWQCAGVARFAWNWAWREYERRTAEGQKVKIVGKGDTLKSEFAALKKTEYPWLGEVQSYAYQQAFADFKKAINRYFDLKKKGLLTPPPDGKPRRDGKPFGWPRTKSRFRSTPSFYLANNGGIAVEGQKVKIVGKGDTLKSEFAALKKTEYPWLGEVQSYAYQQAFADFKKAVRRYFDLKKKGLLTPPPDGKPRRDGKPFGWPRTKSRFRSTPSFYLANNGGIAVEGHQAKIQKCPGLVNMAESLRFDGKIMGARVSYRAGHWWLSVQVEIEADEPPVHDGPPVGVDLGIKYLAEISDDEVPPFPNPKAYEKAQKKLRRLQRKLDRQRRANNPDNYSENGTVKKGVAEWRKSKAMLQTERRVAKLHFRAFSIRNEESHKMTTQIARDYGFIGVENLNIKGMVKNRRLAKAISDAAMYEKRRQLEYKAEWNGGRVVAVDQWYASSKICNNCGWVNVNLKLSDRVWTCGGCGQINRRDKNAAKNIRDEALRIAGLL